MARVRDAVVQRVRREQAQLDLDSRDGMHGVGFADGVGADLAEADAGDLALFEKFGHGLDRGLDRHVGIAPRAFEDVDGFGAG